MPLIRRQTLRPSDSQMLAVADRLFHEFEDMPVITVIRELGAARAELRDAGEPITPDAVETIARTRLQSRTLQPTRNRLVVA